MGAFENRCLTCFGEGQIQVWEDCQACNGTGEGPEPDDPPEYDPYDDAADQAEDHAAAQRELAAIEAEEARGG